MKLISIWRRLLVAAVLVCNAGAAYAEQEVSYLPQIDVRHWNVVKEGREVRFVMQVDLSRLKIRTQHTMAVTPVLISEDGSREWAFPPIVIDGGTRSKVYLRARRLESVELPPYHDEVAQVIICPRREDVDSYDYLATVPYERGMLNGQVELREEVHGCVNCEKGDAEWRFPEVVLPEFVPAYRFRVIAPDPEPVKVRAETRTARLQFRQDSYRIRPDYKNNQAELDTVSHSIRLVQTNPDLVITGIYITGYASPEGTVAHNMRLSERRARALADYICQHEEIARDLLHVDWKGEDWEGLRVVLDKYPMLHKRDAVLRIMDRYTADRDLCDRKLEELKPADVYHRLLTELYPQLRRNEYRIVYHVRNFDLEEARRLLDERPDLLSLAEIYKVAASCEKGSADYEKAMRVAATYYPDSPAVLNDRAMAALEGGKGSEAVALLEQEALAQQHPDLLNTLGVAYARSGDPRRAAEMFRLAAANGSQEASHNLAQVEQVIDQL